jgi:16S rRNA processing protein RimM
MTRSPGGAARPRSPNPALLRAARVRRPHGVRGELSVESLGGDAGRFRRGVKLTVEQTGSILTVRSARNVAGGELLVSFAEIDTPEAAAPLRGAYLCVAPQAVRHLLPGEWFVWQLVGLAAVDGDGHALGEVTDVEAGPAHDILVVGTPAGERRFPMVSAFVTKVDLEAGRIVLTPWEEEE